MSRSLAAAGFTRAEQRTFDAAEFKVGNDLTVEECCLFVRYYEAASAGAPAGSAPLLCLGQARRLLERLVERPVLTRADWAGAPAAGRAGDPALNTAQVLMNEEDGGTRLMPVYVVG
jgi:hypothetical protein